MNLKMLWTISEKICKGGIEVDEYTNLYVDYLNSLHNYNAQNPNAYGERNVESPFYAQTIVEIDICQYIISSLTDKEPHILILTGHAGDGKTSLMFQALNKLGIKPSFRDPILEVMLPSGAVCCCIKDFSELSDEKKNEMMQTIINYPKQGKYVFMVANTGPLINTFGNLFEDSTDKEQAKMELINAMGSNKGELIDIHGYPFLVINIAATDNTAFPRQYLRKVVAKELWTDCAACSKRSYCHIIKNRDLIDENIDHVCDFISKYYIWQTEYGYRLTIRSMTEQIAYMITGGIGCGDINPMNPHRLLFFNLFFGYFGTMVNTEASSIRAVKLARDANLDSRRLRADEDLIIRKCYSKLFSQSVCDLISQVGKESFLSGWCEELRRMYFFLSIVPQDVWDRDTEDIFSKQYAQYLAVRNGIAKPNKAQRRLLVDALRMMYLGTVVSDSNSSTIPITLSKESGIAQSVQLVVGEININDIEIIVEPNSAMNASKMNLILCLCKKEKIPLSLPMINYFEELRCGVISTNIDPQLSHGIEGLKSRLLKVVSSSSEDLEIIILNNTGYEKKGLAIEDGLIRLS